MLYFVGAGDRIKIGISRDPDVRRATLQTGNPSQCRVLLSLDITNEAEIERLLHSRLDAVRERGEWFRISLSTAFQHLTDIREKLRFRDASVLPPPRPPALQLADCASEFETWLISTGIVEPSQWNRESWPLTYLWDEFGRDFIKDRGAAPTPNHAMQRTAPRSNA